MSVFGQSMGGHGALILALKNPGKYKVRYHTGYTRNAQANTDLYRSKEIKHNTKFCNGVKRIHCFSCSSSLIATMRI